MVVREIVITNCAVFTGANVDETGIVACVWHANEAGNVWVSLIVGTYLLKREFMPVCRLAVSKNDP